MIDGFVLLIPLVLLPILVLFVFVGCVLDRSGNRSAPIRFSYVGDFSDVQRIEVTFTFTPTEQEGSQFADAAGTLDIKGDQVQPNGATDLPDGTVSFSDEGTVTCSCTVTKKPPQPGDPAEQFTTDSLGKDKDEDADPPPFTLVRDGAAFTFHLE
jgi:hypothetical protein